MSDETMRLVPVEPDLVERLGRYLSPLDFETRRRSSRNQHAANKARTHYRKLAKKVLRFKPISEALSTPSGEVVPEWVVNDIAELGVKIGERFYWLYKGQSLVYGKHGDDVKDGIVQHDDGGNMHWRPVFKREFGECCHPVNYADPTRIGTVSLDDSDDWKPLPTAHSSPAQQDDALRIAVEALLPVARANTRLGRAGDPLRYLLDAVEAALKSEGK